MSIRRGDTVKILTGRDRGKTGKVLAVDKKSNRATVEGLNIYFRHERAKKAGQKGQKLQFPLPVHLSDLMFVCPHCGKPARAGKTRICKKCGKKS